MSSWWWVGEPSKSTALLPSIPLPPSWINRKENGDISVAAEATLDHKASKECNTSLSMVKVKQFQCPYCPMLFTRGHNLKSHVFTHTKEKPLKCSHCHMAFSRQYDLKRWDYKMTYQDMSGNTRIQSLIIVLRVGDYFLEPMHFIAIKCCIVIH